MSAASKAIIVPRPPLKKKTTQIKDTSMIKKNKKKFSLMKTLFSNAFVCTKPKLLQEQSNSVSDHHHRNAAAAAAAAEKELLVVNKKNEESINDVVTYEMNPYYISHKFPFYNTQLIINSEEEDEDDDDDSDKPVYDEERPPMEIVSFVQRKAAKQEIIAEEEEEEEEEEFVNPFGKDGKSSTLNSCFFYKRRSQIRRSSCINNPLAAILLH